MPVPEPAIPTLSAQASAFSPQSVPRPPVNLSLDESGTKVPAPANTQGDYDHLAYDLHDRCRRRGYARDDSKAVRDTCQAAMDEVERKRHYDMADATNTSGTLPGTRNRSMDDAMGSVDAPPVPQKKRCAARNLD